MNSVRSRTSPLGWLAIPALLGVLVLVGMALSTESRDEFESRTGQDSTDQEPDRQPQDQDRSQNSGQPSEQQQAEGSNGQEQGQQQETSDADQAADQVEETSGRGGGEDSRPVVIRTPNGDVVVQLGDGETVRAVPGDSQLPSDPSRTLSPSDDGDFGGLRVTEDGELEPIDEPTDPARDFGITPTADGGVGVTRPDGSAVTLEPTADGGLTTSDGQSQEPQAVPAGEDVILQSAEQFPEGHRTSPEAEPLILQAEDGPVRIELNAEGDLVANQPDPDSVIEVDEDDLVAIRVNENGDLEVVPLDEIGPNDTVLVPSGGGVDLVRPDGSRVEFRVDGENDGVTATEVTADGREIELTPNPDGSVTLEDGTTVGPIDFAEDGGAIERLLDQTADLPWPWVFGAIALLAALSIATAVYLHRTRPDDAFDFGQLVETGVDVDEFERFLQILSHDPDPDRAIRLAFYAVERGLCGLPPRRPDETPFEWHHRVSEVRPELAESLGPICDRFAMVRFAPGNATTDDRDAVVARLRQLNLLATDPTAIRTEPLAGV